MCRALYGCVCDLPGDGDDDDQLVIRLHTYVRGRVCVCVHTQSNIELLGSFLLFSLKLQNGVNFFCWFDLLLNAPLLI